MENSVVVAAPLAAEEEPMAKRVVKRLVEEPAWIERRAKEDVVAMPTAPL